MTRTLIMPDWAAKAGPPADVEVLQTPMPDLYRNPFHPLSFNIWMMSDIPSEARWRSLNWGVLKLVEPKRINSP